MGPCLDENLIAALGERQLAGAEIGRVHVHLDACSACRRVVAEVARSLDRAPYRIPNSFSRR